MKGEGWLKRVKRGVEAEQLRPYMLPVGMVIARPGSLNLPDLATTSLARASLGASSPPPQLVLHHHHYLLDTPSWRRLVLPPRHCHRPQPTPSPHLLAAMAVSLAVTTTWRHLCHSPRHHHRDALRGERPSAREEGERRPQREQGEERR